ncbi:hypothetical protein [Paraburkholderia solisilvae]|uniref:Uncharacterized protein n=1 Tax=Paraburkholderia solisilvae TaxID=624376 RepID=A0A6J5DN68_9BURK|nr:hypothetical protein [Paraburkholderia solisilvae]CAB3755353.1 hypothetical protein LMG29739_02165 [Paraburkholderia solisilvae]
MKLIERIVVFVVISIAGGSVSAEITSYEAESLCRQGEMKYFSCELQNSKKIASVCAKDNISPDQGYVQYRFGTPRHVELEFPGKHIAPRGKISIVNVSRLRDGLGSHLKFSNGSYTYVVSNAVVPGEVYVEKNGKIVFDEICKGDGYTPFDYAVWDGIEYGVENRVDDLNPYDR